MVEACVTHAMSPYSTTAPNSCSGCWVLHPVCMQVALKRIPDVLNNAENAKRVLREVCILRRLSHPHIITLSDVFLKPSSTGQFGHVGTKVRAGLGQ